MTFNRRDFLKLSGAGLLSLFLPELHLDSVQAAEPQFQGRVLHTWTSLYDTPSFLGNKILPLPRDTLLTVTELVQTTDKDAYNPIWYRIGEQGFIYSGWVQPVESTFNEPVTELPASGVTAEVTIPSTDTHWKASIYSRRGPQLYYSTTHWVIDVEYNQDEKIVWYYIYDDRLKTAYYADGRNLRIIPPEELTPLSPHVPNSSKRVEVDLDRQIVTAYELWIVSPEETTSISNNYIELRQQRNPVEPTWIPVRTMRAATGTKSAPTPKGWFKTYYKRSSRHMLGGDLAAPEFDLPGVPWVTYINGSGVAFHGTYWHNDYGKPQSHGCINLTPKDAKWLFRWTMPNVPAEERFIYQPGEGTNVYIY